MHIGDEVTARTAKASVAFGRLRTNVWERNGIRLHTKVKVYMTVILSSLLYACKTYTVYQRHVKRFNHFHLSCLRKLSKNRWQNKIPDTSKDAKGTYSIKAGTDGLTMLQEHRMSDYQRKFSWRTSGSAAIRIATKTPLKHR